MFLLAFFCNTLNQGLSELPELSQIRLIEYKCIIKTLGYQLELYKYGSITVRWVL